MGETRLVRFAKTWHPFRAGQLVSVPGDLSNQQARDLAARGVCHWVTTTPGATAQPTAEAVTYSWDPINASEKRESDGLG
jgi:hypothetical protein